MDDDRTHERLISAWSAALPADEIARVRAAATTVRRLRRVQWAVLACWAGVTITQVLAPADSRLEATARGLSLVTLAIFLVIGFVAASRSAKAALPPDAEIGRVARALRDERMRDLRWWAGGWSWGAWIAGAALIVAWLSWQARTREDAAGAVLMLVAIGLLSVAAWRYMRELSARRDLSLFDALVAGIDGRPPDRPRMPRPSVRTGLRLLELGVACWAAVAAIRGPDPLIVGAHEYLSAVTMNDEWAQRLGTTHRGNVLPVSGDPVDRYCAVRLRLAPSLAEFARIEERITEALAIDFERRADSGTRHDVRWQEHAIAWEEARLTLLTAADRALRSGGLRPDDLRRIGARVETHEASAAFRLPPSQARALVAARLRMQAIEAILADPARSAIHPLASAAAAPARETLVRLTAQAGPPPTADGAPCGADPLAGIDWLAVLDAQPSPWNEALR